MAGNARRAAEKGLGVSLPADYVEFLTRIGGGGVEAGGAWLILWPFEELVAMNEGYGAREFVPGLVLFGTDGGLEAFGFDAREGQGMEVVSVPFVPMDWREAIPRGRTFTAFLENLRRFGGPSSPDGGTTGAV